MQRGYSVKTSRGGAAAAAWIFRGDETRRRRGRDAKSPRRRVAATPRTRGTGSAWDSESQNLEGRTWTEPGALGRDKCRDWAGRAKKED